MFHPLLPLFIFLFSFTDIAIIPKEKDKFIPLTKAISKNQVEAKATSKGGHSGNCMELKIKNLLPDSLFLLIEPGHDLLSEDENEQDILIVKQQQLIFTAGQTIIIEAFGFCCQAKKSSPKTGSNFFAGKMASPELVKLADFIDKHDFPINAIQNAVWVISDDHEIASVHHEDINKILPLRKKLAEIKGIEIPWYSIIYERDTAMLFSGVPEKLMGEINYYLRNQALIVINVRRKDGKVIEKLMEGTIQNSGEYSFDLNLNVKGWPKGEYSLNIYMDDNLNLKKEFKL